MHKAARIFFNNLINTSSEEYRDKVEEFAHSDYRDFFEKGFDFLFSWSYPWFRKIANKLNKKLLRPDNSNAGYAGDLGFFIKSGMAIFSISGMFILLSIIIK